MCELETLMQQFNYMAISNPDVLFRIVPGTLWSVDFLVGGLWWGVKAEHPNEGIKEVLKSTLAYFPTVTDEVIQAELKNRDDAKCEVCKAPDNIEGDK